MALDLKRLKAAVEQLAPFLEALTNLSFLVESATETERLVALGEQELSVSKKELSQVQGATQHARQALEDLEMRYTKERDEHKASILALIEERRKAMEEMDKKLLEHKASFESDLEYVTKNHQRKLAEYASEQAKAENSLESVRKDLEEMTKRFRQSLGL